MTIKILPGKNYYGSDLKKKYILFLKLLNAPNLFYLHFTLRW